MKLYTHLTEICNFKILVLIYGHFVHNSNLPKYPFCIVKSYFECIFVIINIF